MQRPFLRMLNFPLKVNVGCGNEPFQGWINLDLQPGDPSRYPLGCNRWASLSRQFLCIHIQRTLFGAYPGPRGGSVSCRMPSISSDRRSRSNRHAVRAGNCRQYYEDTWAQQPWLQKYGYSWIKTGAEYINIGFRDWGHQWLYDFEELDRRLREAGFSRIERAAWGESNYPELRKRETRDETLLICEATK